MEDEKSDESSEERFKLRRAIEAVAIVTGLIQQLNGEEGSGRRKRKKERK